MGEDVTVKKVRRLLQKYKLKEDIKELKEGIEKLKEKLEVKKEESQIRRIKLKIEKLKKDLEEKIASIIMEKEGLEGKELEERVAKLMKKWLNEINDNNKGKVIITKQDKERTVKNQSKSVNFLI